MSGDRELGALEAMLLDTVGTYGGRVWRWEDEPTPELLEKLGPDGAELHLAMREAKLATRRCEHVPDGPACPACSLRADRALEFRLAELERRKAKA